MKTITISELQKNLSSYLEQARNGDSFVILKDGKPLCELGPTLEAKLALFDSLAAIAKDVDLEKAREERLNLL